MDPVPVVTTLAKTMSVKEATSKLKNLRCELRQMERAAKTLEKHHCRIWYPNAEAKALAVLVWMLSGDAKWAFVWIQQWQRLNMMRTLASPGQITEQILQQRRIQYGGATVMQEALRDLQHPWRIRADMFLVETLLYEEVLEQNQKGLVIPANSIPAMFIKKWHLRPAPQKVKDIMQRLQTNNKDFKKTWSRAFRHLWQLCVTAFLPRTPMDENERQFRVVPAKTITKIGDVSLENNLQ